MNAILLISIVWCLNIGFSFGKPRITESPVDDQVLEGGNVTLRCVVEGIDSNEINPVQWSKHGFGLGYDRDSPIWKRYSMVGDVSLGEYHLQIRHVDLAEDDNDFECQVTDHGLRSNTAKLTVLVPSSGPFVENIKDLNGVSTVDAVADKLNEIKCHAFDGKPAATLKWFKDNQEIYDGIFPALSSPLHKLYNTTSTLQFTPNANDANSIYSCVMTSDALSSSEEKRVSFQLNLLKPPIVSVHLPEKLKEGDYLEIQCRSQAVPPVTAYRWYLNEKLQAQEISSTFNFGLINKTWHGSNVGCEAKNEAGYSKRSVRKINVFYAPEFVGGTDKIDADIGQNVTLRCEWDSNPQPTINWVREDTDVVLGRSSELHLAKVNQTHSGKYYCYAEAKEVGKNKATTELVVHGPPIFNHAKTQYAVLNDDAIITCSLKSFPGIQHVTWTWIIEDYGMVLRDSETWKDLKGNIKYRSTFEVGGNEAQLTVSKAATEDLHSYKCSVGNNYGDRTTVIELKEDTTKAAQVFTLAASIGIAAGIAILIISALIIVWCCMRTKKQQKTTNFDKMDKKSPVNKEKERTYEKDETIAINHLNDAKSGTYNVRSLSVSSHGEEASSESESDGVKPSSGQDDGYHTEEANSWYRTKDHNEKTDSAPIPNNAYHHAPYIDLPPNPDAVDHKQPLLEDQFQDFPPRPISANRYPYEPPVFPHPPTFRSASAMGRFSPAVPFDPRMYPDSNVYTHPQNDFYPVNSVHTPLQPIMEPGPMFDNSPYVGRPRLTPVPTTMVSVDRFQHASSQSSLDKFERESALSNSIIPTRIDALDHPGQNLPSRLSQSSKSSEFNRPLVARMATHV